ncbi:MAG: RluA family pseudouridine synthase [Deltaproteobacteria bacterium]|nr:RluA family pseudouridine synthase [Deltaproteobacteria bacterium]
METEEKAGRICLTADGTAGARLDVWIAGRLPGTSRSQVRKWIDDGRVLVSGRSRKASFIVEPGDVVIVDVPPPQPAVAAPEDIPLKIVFEDGDLCVLDKPAGIVVHPAHGHAGGTLVNALLFHIKDLSSVGGELKPGIVHRLDKGTSGLMVVSKNDRSHLDLQRQFAGRTVEKTYLALVYGAPRADEGTFDTPYGRNPGDRKKFSSKVREGKRAVTSWRVRERRAGASLVEVRLLTGRTHQVRVHFADQGMPLLGDLMYGAARRIRGLPAPARALVETLDRVMLHAASLSFDHPATRERLTFTSPVPPEMQAVINALRAGSEPKRI